MSPVTVIPTALAQAAAAARNPRNASTCGLFDVAGRLGQANRSVPFLRRTIDALIATKDFPAPFPTVRGATIIDTVTADSRWPLAAVDAWFDDRLPPSARGLIGQAERVEIDSRLSNRAFTLFSGGAA